jgi:hypothetical protein
MVALDEATGLNYCADTTVQFAIVRILALTPYLI